MKYTLQIPAFHVPGFTDSGFSCSGFYRFRLFVFRVLQIPAFRVPGFTDSGFSCSGFYRFRLFMFRVLQIPAFHVPDFLVPCSVPRSVPRFPVPCFTDSRIKFQECKNGIVSSYHSVCSVCTVEYHLDIRSLGLSHATVCLIYN